MGKSLYVRVVVTFMLVVLASLTASALITYNLYEGKIFRQLEKELMETGKELIRVHQSGQAKDLEGFLSNVFALRSQAALFGSDGTVKVFGTGKPDSFASPEAIRDVLNGGVHRFDYSAASLLEKRSIGLPFESNGVSYALFLKPAFRGILARVRESLTTAVMLTMTFGSLLFIVATYYLVKPIKRLTFLTSRIAKGHFDERAPDTRHDEIGDLARSFNLMSLELSRMEQMRKEFVSNVSHEFQSPLTSIKGFAVALRENEFSKEQQARYLTIIEDESRRLARLCDNLLRLAALESRQAPLRQVRFDVARQLRKVFLALQPQWQEKALEIRLPEEEPVWIHADEAQLEQVWHNLIGNSIKYTPPGGEIHVGMGADDNAVEIVLSDTGEGIAAEDLPYIFDRFYKADKERDRSVKGSGLGLSIVKHIVELHGGTLEVDSEPGRGTTVTVRLPLGAE